MAAKGDLTTSYIAAKPDATTGQLGYLGSFNVDGTPRTMFSETFINEKNGSPATRLIALTEKEIEKRQSRTAAALANNLNTIPDANSNNFTALQHGRDDIAESKAGTKTLPEIKHSDIPTTVFPDTAAQNTFFSPAGAISPTAPTPTP